MRKFSVLAAATALFLSGNAFASGPASGNLEPEARICAQIGDLIGKSAFNLGDAQEATASVRFTLNSEKEIVVLSVETEDARLESFLKSRLNYQKVQDPTMAEGKTYEVPIRITA